MSPTWGSTGQCPLARQWASTRGLDVWAAIEVDGQVVIHEALAHQLAPAWLIAVQPVGHGELFEYADQFIWLLYPLWVCTCTKSKRSLLKVHNKLLVPQDVS